MKKVEINIESLFRRCGVELKNCDPSFGGKWAYCKKGDSITIAGFRTQRAALLEWFRNEFSSDVGQVLLKDYIKGV